MALIFDGVRFSSFTNEGDVYRQNDKPLRLEANTDDRTPTFRFLNGSQVMYTFSLEHNIQYCRVGKKGCVLSLDDKSFLFQFSSDYDNDRFESIIRKVSSVKRKKSVFTERTDSASAEQYFQFYGYLSQQQNMMQDYIRTSTYQKAMLQNHEDFRDKVILDVGAGTGILSFFAIQAGARKAYAIEASSMATHAEVLVHSNKLSGRIVILPGMVEEVAIPEQVDMIISEPMGYMLLNERMLESYLHAKKWLKPGGKMFPSLGDLHIAPFTDEALYMEQFTKANFWYQQSFHGVDLSSLRNAALQECFRQPIVDTFDIRICLARSFKYTIDFQTTNEKDLYRLDVPVSFTITNSGTVHGLAFWFDVAFVGSMSTVYLSTAPTEPLTHWYQVRCLLQTPIFVKAGQVLSGKVILTCNKRQSYDIDIEVGIQGSSSVSTNRLDLKNPFFRYTGAAPAAPPGYANTSPTENYWAQVAPEQNPVPLNGVVDSNGIQQSTGTAAGAGGVVQSNLVPLANTDPISHSAVMASGSSQLHTGRGNMQRTLPVPTSVGFGMTSTYVTQSNDFGANSQYSIGNQYLSSTGQQVPGHPSGGF
ncbi:histone-arginine methyltransferase CARM1-like isoform X2 [Ptychodera flava]|uniref:histone-arginine methyltransferase CARM1-like isoform X2 n=1 Tax=Ptychodera flava TaxID=63121 RepID=UPI00396A239C